MLHRMDCQKVSKMIHTKKSENLPGAHFLEFENTQKAYKNKLPVLAKKTSTCNSSNGKLPFVNLILTNLPQAHLPFATWKTYLPAQTARNPCGRVSETSLHSTIYTRHMCSWAPNTHVPYRTSIRHIAIQPSQPHQPTFPSNHP